MIIWFHCLVSWRNVKVDLFRKIDNKTAFNSSSIILSSHHSFMCVDVWALCWFENTLHSFKIVRTFTQIKSSLFHLILEVSRLRSSAWCVISKLMNISRRNSFLYCKTSFTRSRIFKRILKCVDSKIIACTINFRDCILILQSFVIVLINPKCKLVSFLNDNLLFLLNLINR